MSEPKEKKLFRIVKCKERKKLQRCQRNVVRQLKIKFIVLDLNSHKRFFLPFYIIIVSYVHIEMSRSVGKAGRKTRNDHENHFDLPLLIFKALSSTLFKCVPYTVELECHLMPCRLFVRAYVLRLATTDE